MKTKAGRPLWPGRVQHQNVNEFKLDRMFSLWEVSLLNSDISARTGHAASTVMRVWTQFIEYGPKERRWGTVPCNVITERDDHHLVYMAVTDEIASSKG